MRKEIKPTDSAFEWNGLIALSTAARTAVERFCIDGGLASPPAKETRILAGKINADIGFEVGADVGDDALE